MLVADFLEVARRCKSLRVSKGDMLNVVQPAIRDRSRFTTGLCISPLLTRGLLHRVAIALVCKSASSESLAVNGHNQALTHVPGLRTIHRRINLRKNIIPALDLG